MSLTEDPSQVSPRDATNRVARSNVRTGDTSHCAELQDGAVIIVVALILSSCQNDKTKNYYRENGRDFSSHFIHLLLPLARRLRLRLPTSVCRFSTNGKA